MWVSAGLGSVPSLSPAVALPLPPDQQGPAVTGLGGDPPGARRNRRRVAFLRAAGGALSAWDVRRRGWAHAALRQGNCKAQPVIETCVKPRLRHIGSTP
jgi:hypothetical protein